MGAVSGASTMLALSALSTAGHGEDCDEGTEPKRAQPVIGECDNWICLGFPTELVTAFTGRSVRQCVQQSLQGQHGWDAIRPAIAWFQRHLVNALAKVPDSDRTFFFL